MLLKPLGKSGLKISEIGQGTWAYRGGPEALRAGIACGMTHVDTAEMYGTEDAVGKAIADIRDEVFLASKVSPQHLHYNDVLRAAEGSLSRLNTTFIDLYMIHWPNRRIPIQETMRAMEDLVKQGKIRYIGVSNFSVEELKDAQEALSSYKIVSNQVEYNMQTRDAEKELIPYCKAQGITIVAYSPLTRGQVSRRKDEVLEKIAAKYKKSKSQVVLNFLTREENVVAIPKADRIEHVKENCEASGWRLSKEDLRLIDERF